jgi:hypothetical protein
MIEKSNLPKTSPICLYKGEEKEGGSGKQNKKKNEGFGGASPYQERIVFSSINENDILYRRRLYSLIIYTT